MTVSRRFITIPVATITMAGQYTISIPSPCNESWEDMQPHEGGRFCGHCQHAVIDFSMMTDAEVLKALNAHSGGRVCGRMAASQLDRTMKEVPAKRRSLWPAAMLTSLFGIASPAANPVAAKPATFITNEKDTVAQPTQPVSDSSLRKLTGTVVDQTGDTLIGVSIRMDTLHLVTQTDAKGRFELYLPAEWVDKCPVITVAYVGFTWVQIFAEHNGKNEFLPVNVTLEPEFKGQMEVSRVMIFKDRITYRIRRFFRRGY